MALPSTGPISFSDINLEQGNATSRNVSIGTLRDEWYATTGHADFAGSGEISLSAWRSKSWSSVPGPISFNSTNALIERIAVTWSPGSDGGSPILIYGVEYRKTGDTEWIPDGIYTTSHLFTGLTRNTSYQIRVRAINAVGPGPYTIIFPNTLRTVTPNISGITSTSSGIQITFSHPPGATLFYFDVYNRESNPGAWSTNPIAPVSGASTSATIPFPPGTAYRMRAFYAATSDTPSEYSDYAQVSYP